MHVVTLDDSDDLDGWRVAARALAMAGVNPADIVWQVGDQATDLFAGAADPLPTSGTPFAVPRAFLDLEPTCHVYVVVGN